MSSGSEVRVWEEVVTIPTYPIGAPDKNPMFLEKRVYQGSSGAVYPLPVIDKIGDEKADQPWNAVFLENRYLKIMILPQLGGRVQMALDKTNDYHFIYYNRVIKPALVGLAGPWISGGIEFNWPQHHRPTTYMPVEHALRKNPDGSATIWISEIDRMYGTKSLAGFTLHPDRAYLELSVTLFNRTPLPQTFLWWANPAAHVDEHHQSIFPPDVNAVMDHGKRDVSTFPIATGTYYKVNYAPGTDISRYKNIPVPTSYMAYQSDFDFVASYDHRRRAGLLCIADHHVAPGKKQWTWGCSDFGRAWDRQLTDEDGPYIELMCGVFTDNQPDFSWMHPYETKSFKQYFMPYKQIGAIKNATIEAAITLDVDGDRAYIAAYVTSPQNGLSLVLKDGAGKILFEKRSLDLSPESAFESTLPLGSLKDPGALELSLLARDGRVIVRYKPAKVSAPTVSPAQPALLPEQIDSTEELFLTAQHLEQYRHATRDPELYYREALRRAPADAQNNNALGLLLYRRGMFREAEPHFRTAIATLTRRNPNPYDGQAHYNLGLCLKMQGRYDDAYAAFYKATWSGAQQGAAFFCLAQIAAIEGNIDDAIAFADQALDRNSHNAKARHLKVALLRRTGKSADAMAEANFGHTCDPLDFGALNELSLLTDQPSDAHAELSRALRGDAQNHIELALDYASAGLHEEALNVLSRLLPGDDSSSGVYPMLLYLAGWISDLAGNSAGALRYLHAAARQSPRLCFPNRLEEMLALQAATRINPGDGIAHYHLGNLLYSKRAYDLGIEHWERARELAPSFPTTHRNLALAYFNKRHDSAAALSAMQRAFELDPTDARVLFELDQLHRKMNLPPQQRLALLEKHEPLVEQRDDLYVERINLLLLLARFDQAQELLTRRKFHPWEGGEGRVSGAHVASLLGIAKAHLRAGRAEQALSALERARVYPHNLGEGKLYGALENDLDYFTGLAFRALHRDVPSQQAFERATLGLAEPASAMFYNDQPPHMIFYQGLALRELDRHEEAERRFGKLIEYGRQHLHDHVAIDYFAVSLPEFLVFDDDLDRRNAIHCHYMMGLGHLGMAKLDAARDALRTVITKDASHLGAAVHLQMIEQAESGK